MITFSEAFGFDKGMIAKHYIPEKIKTKLDSVILFSDLDGKDIQQTIFDVIRKSLTTNVRYEKIEKEWLKIK